MKLVPKDVAGAVIWLFACTLCTIMILTIVARMFGFIPSEMGVLIFKDVTKYMTGAIVMYIGLKLRG